MTLFNPEINSIEEDILYHETQIKDAQERLDQVKVSQAYSDTVISSLEDFFENTDPFLYEVLKGHINQMFEENKVTYNSDLKEVKLPSALLSSTKERTTMKEQPSSLSSTVTNVEEIKSPIAGTTAPVVALSQPQKEFGTLSYHELTGRPDMRPDTYKDLAPNITYSSSGRAYVGFNDKKEAEEFSNRINEPSMIGDTDTMKSFKYEVKFYCTKEFIEDIVNDWTPEQKAELDWQERLLRVAPDIFYDPSSSKCFVGFSNRDRASTYGAHLKEIHELFDSRYTVDNPKVVTNCKHELVIKSITEENARKLAGLNLKKELDHKANKAITDKWNVLTEDVQIYVPQRQEIKKPQVLSENDFPSYPYTEIPLTEVEFGDVITSTPHGRSAYTVKEHKGEFVLAECLYHKSLPSRVGEEYSFSKIYLVEKASSCVEEKISATV